MKRYATILGATMLGLFSMTTFAVTGNQTSELLMLNEGESDSQIISSNPKRYRIQVIDESIVQLSSEHLASDSSASVNIQGSLYDEEGRLVSKDSDQRGHFLITKRVAPGTYILEVEGNAMGSPDEVSKRYNLHLDFE
ncbi:MULTISPECIES: hypothetical protein [Halomonadaceae]|jgi:hypothetical protein|uniref:Carboxypeptidase regulatory-like domain-containing protein n=1 Tax=Onishia taeanensis TaxID=284577 RepID=A0A328XFR1_9GAMM|nr:MULTISPECIES: hypothetical protein [Halomonas]MDI4638316.1 hypothetical protein [Halomonas sp. BMC7]NUJ59307.1 hypothetical protein [Halomonas taeanensis]RAR57075.1 hypothetical protein BCL93_1168 [Halomonas taeanensis]|tara:strand:+ start:226 stop:639 length:414 start_codon:yes stop_codon:yes gene_type:complete